MKFICAIISCSLAIGVLGQSTSCVPSTSAPRISGKSVNGHQPGIWVASSNLPLNLPEDDPTRRAIIESCTWDDDRVLGGNIIAPWSKFDHGPDAGDERYDWTWVDEQISLWTDRGKKVNLLVWSSAQQTKQLFDGESMTPQWLLDLDEVETITCNDSPHIAHIPVHNNEIVRDHFMDALEAFHGHYKDEDYVNYFRFGAGVGSENYPINNSIQVNGPCRKTWEEAGGDADTWKEHVLFMVDFFGELQLRGGAPIVVSLNDYKGVKGNSIPDAVFEKAKHRRLGLGCQGPTDRHRRNYESGHTAGCTANWCQIFEEAKNDERIPILEIQTPNSSGPRGRSPDDGSGPGYTPTGPLQALGPFLLKRGVTSFELYPSEFRIANLKDGNDLNVEFNEVYDETFDCIAKRSVRNAQGNIWNNPCRKVPEWEPSR